MDSDGRRPTEHSRINSVSSNKDISHDLSKYSNIVPFFYLWISNLIIIKLCFLSCQLFRKVSPSFWQMGQALGNNIIQFNSSTSQKRFWHQSSHLAWGPFAASCLSPCPCSCPRAPNSPTAQGFLQLLLFFNNNSSFNNKHAILTLVWVHFGMGSSLGTVKTESRLALATVHWQLSLDLALKSTGTQTNIQQLNESLKLPQY